jgi:hypothetical protein
MAIPTFLVGVLPGYQVLGTVAPVLLTLLRMIQGLSVGGEYTTSIVFMVEHAPPGRRGMIGALGCCGAIAGILLGSATAALLSNVLPADAMEVWGWRIPFLMGLVVGLAGFFLRRRLVEAAIPHDATRSPLRETVRHHGWLLVRLAGLSMFNAGRLLSAVRLHRKLAAARRRHRPRPCPGDQLAQHGGAAALHGRHGRVVGPARPQADAAGRDSARFRVGRAPVLVDASRPAPLYAARAASVSCCRSACSSALSRR